MSKHTPTPWWITPNLATVDLPAATHFISRDDSPGAIVEVFDLGGFGIANAEFIVRAVNSHDELLEALRKANEWIAAVDVAPRGMPGVGDTQIVVLREIEAALAKAEAGA